LTNLLSNAVKFTERGEIVLRVKILDVDQYQVRLLFVVRDTGIGIPDDKLPYLFDSFTQLDGSTSRKFGGTGLGLAICKSLAELMDGELWVESQIGKGSTFYFSGVFEKRAESKEKEHIVPENITGMKVLVVDDNESSRMMITEMLEKFSCESVAIAEGSECVPALLSAQQNEDPFQIVLLDWRMPPPDGIAVARLIRDEEAIADTPIVLMTAFGSSKEIEEVGSGLVDAFLLKPIKQSSLFDTIISLFACGEQGGTFSEGLISRESIGREAVRGSRLLLVEDNYINQQVALEILASAGIEVVVVDNGIEGVKAVEQGHFDAVLMDIQMPEMDGFEATKIIRKNKRSGQLPIIAMTANAMKGDREKCIAAGMNDYISKPIDTTQLFTCLRTWIKTPGKAAEREDLSEDRQTRLPDSLPGINLSECMSRLGGNRALIVTLLKDFLAKNKNSIKDIQNHLDAGDYETAERLAHTLKGVSGNIGAERVFENAKELNNAIRGRTTQLLPALLEATDEAITEVLQGLEKELDVDVESKKGSGSIELPSVIGTLQQALKENDFESEKIFTSIKGKLVEEGCGKEAEEIAEHLDNFNFKAAGEILDTVVTKLDLNL
jgi:CheY-like chemotaxis protein